MKKFLLTLTMVLGLGFNVAQATPVEFDIVDLYDWGRLYSYDGASFTPTNVNPFDGSTGNVIPQNTFGQANGEEDSWGVAQVEQASFIGGSTFYDNDLDPYELTIMFYGFDDDFISNPNLLGNVDIGSIAGRIQIYQDFNKDYDPSLGTAARTGTDDYTTATEGLLVLDLIAIPQNQAGHTLITNFNFNSNAGAGAVFLSVTGAGAWDHLYDTNNQNFGADFLFSFTSRDNNDPTVGDWVVRGDGRAEGSVIPEPATMILMGSGLVGMALRRKKVAA